MPTNADDRTDHPEPFDLALQEHYSRNPNWKRVGALLAVAVEAGDPLAVYSLATKYLFGDKHLKIAKNATKAFALLKIAAPNFGRAAYDLSICYFQGAGTRRDDRAGFHWIEQAAALGDIQALRELAVCLEEGYGVKANARRAAKYQQQYDTLRAKLEKIDAPKKRKR